MMAAHSGKEQGEADEDDEEEVNVSCLADAAA